MRWNFSFSFYYWGKGGSPEVNHFANRVPYSQSYGFSSSHVWMWELDHKEGWEPKNWCFLIVVLEKTLESPLDCKEINPKGLIPVNPKRNQPWTFIGRIDAKAPILWPPDAKSQFIGKDPDDGKDWKQEEKGTTEDKMVGGYHQLNGHEFEQTLGNGEGQGSLACCRPPWHGVATSQTQLSNWTTRTPSWVLAHTGPSSRPSPRSYTPAWQWDFCHFPLMSKLPGLCRIRTEMLLLFIFSAF